MRDSVQRRVGEFLFLFTFHGYHVTGMNLFGALGEFLGSFRLSLPLPL
jgi:hypothetical protein